MKRTKTFLIAVFLLASVAASAKVYPKLTVGNQTYSSQDRSMTFTNCSATATYTGGVGFTLHFWGDSILNYPSRMTVIETTQQAPLTIVLDPGIDVVVRARYCGVYSRGDVTIKGPGTFEVLTTSASLLEVDDAISCGGDFTATLGATVNIGKQAGTIRFSDGMGICASGQVKFDAAFANIAGKADSLLYGGAGVKIVGSMVSLWQDWGEGKVYANPVIRAREGKISITGSVLSIVSQGDGICADEGAVFMAQSCGVIFSYGCCILGCTGVAFDQCNLTAISRAYHAVSLDSGSDRPGFYRYRVDDEIVTPVAYFGAGKYYFGTGNAKDCVLGANRVVIDSADIECCSPKSYGIYSYAVEMKSGSMKMIEKMNFKGCCQVSLATSAAEAALVGSGVYTTLNGVCSSFLSAMTMPLYAMSVSDIKGAATGVIRSDDFILRGGDVSAGTAEHGYFATGLGYSATVAETHHPAFIGGSFNGACETSGLDKDNTYQEYADIHPTNKVGKLLSRISEYPYWSYVQQKITVTFDPNGGTVSPSSRTYTEDSAYGTLPTPVRSGAEFVGWYDGTKKVLKSTVIEQGHGDHVLVARWELRPDLVVTASLSPSVITKSEPTKITYVVKNIGLAAADASSVRIQIGNAGWVRSVSALAAGASYSETVTVNGSLFATGSFAVKVTADIGAKVTESDETNNEVSLGTLTVVRNPVNSNYDLQYKKRASSDPSEAWLSSSLTGTKVETTFKIGSPIYIQLGFWNAKQVAISGWIYVRADLVKSTGTSIGYYTWSWQGLSKNVTGYLTDTYRNPAMLQNLKEGSYTLTLTLDSNDYYSETDEANNIRQINFTVYDPTPKPTTYTIEFKSNGGSGVMTSMTCSLDCVYGLSRSLFTKTSKRFAGWKCSNGKHYDDGVLVFNLAKPGETVTMTAIWE